MMKDFLLVGMGSFLGGGARFLVSRVLAAWTAMPLGTFVVNVAGCLLIGFFSALDYGVGPLNAQARLVLTTGFCGGFTTFSTFMNENWSFVKEDDYHFLALYVLGSLAFGGLATVLGHALGKAV